MYTVKLVFWEDTMREYLTKKGWTFEKREFLEHVHGSRFETHEREVAVRDITVMAIEHAFAMELKNAILSI